MTLEQVIGATLRWGVVLTACVVLCGGIGLLMQTTSAAVDFSRLNPAASRLATGEPVLIIRAGLFLLIATPVARVALCAIAFVLERDYVYTAISAIVLIVLLYSVLGLH